MEIQYETGRIPATEDIVALYRRSGLPRPVDDPERIGKMFGNSNLVVTAWDGHRLVGVSRCITDWVWSCYLSDLAVDPDYQQSGIGRKLVEVTKATLGEQSMILLLSVPGAMTYYPKIGFAKEDRGFMMSREK